MTFATSGMGFGRVHHNSRVSCGSIPLADISCAGEEKCSLVNDLPRSISYNLVHQAGPNVPTVAQSTSGNCYDNSMCQDDEMLEDYNLLYKIDDVEPSLISQALIQSSSPLSSPPDSQKEVSDDVTMDDNVSSVSFELSSARRIADLALRNVIGGRQVKCRPGIKVVKPQPRQSLSKIVPSIFNPGFLEVSLAT